MTWMIVGRGAGNKVPLDCEIFGKKVFSFEWEERTFTTFGPPLEGFLENPLLPPPGQNLPDAHDDMIYMHKKPHA